MATEWQASNITTRRPAVLSGTAPHHVVDPDLRGSNGCEDARAHGLASEYSMRWAPIVDRRLNGHVSRHRGPDDTFLEALGHLIRAGGKRFRPILAIAVCELVGGDPWKALDAACAIECIHTSSLILDDLPCMDDARSRRHVPAVHKRYGTATAILVALALFNLAHEILASPEPGAGSLQARRHLFIANAIGANGMIAGQYVDLCISKQPMKSAPLALRELRLLKTSALIAAAAVAGAYSGGATPEQVACVERLGYGFGSLFQKIDDNLDVAEDGGASCVTSLTALLREKELLLESLRKGFPAPSHARLVIESLAHMAVARSS